MLLISRLMETASPRKEATAKRKRSALMLTVSRLDFPKSFLPANQTKVGRAKNRRKMKVLFNTGIPRLFSPRSTTLSSLRSIEKFKVRPFWQKNPEEIKDGHDDFLAVGEGLVEITGERVAIVTDLAVAGENIDEAKAEEARQRATARLSEKLSTQEVASVNAALARSLAQLSVKRRHPRP